jgi:protein HIRA/HIR1
MSHLCWSPDGSFIGASGYRDRFIAPFFQRDSFEFGFALEGHVASINCLSSASFLLKAAHNFCSLIASVDKRGVLAVWIIGEEVRPLVILDRISGSAANDLAWSADGKYLLIALESDPVSREGGILCIRFVRDFGYPVAEPAELAELQSRLSGDPTFLFRRIKSPITKPSFETRERDDHFEMLQLTTQEVIEQQIELVIDGHRTIRPVLLTPSQRQVITFKCRQHGVVSQRIPHVLNMESVGWSKGASLVAEPSHHVIVGDRIVVACGESVFALDKSTGRRLTVPFVIGGPCKHLSVSECKGALLAVSEECFVFELPTMKLLRSFRSLPIFSGFQIVTIHIVIRFARGKSWTWSLSGRTWIGGSVVGEPADVSMEELEELVEAESETVGASQWFEAEMTVLHSVYGNAPNVARETIQTLRDHSETQMAKGCLDRLEKTLLQRLNWES